MLFVPYIIAFILGSIIGSFLNVVIYRLNSGFGIGGRSQCFSCGKTLRWYELVPLLSFLLLRGRCSVCKARISWQYPIIEKITGLVFVLLLWKEEALFSTNNDMTIILFWMVLCVVIFSTLIVIAVYDLRHKIIPDSMVVLFAVGSFVYLLFRSPLLFFYSHGVNILTPPVILPILIDIGAGLTFFLFFFVFWYFSRGTWMGLGDAKLALGIGWFLGWSAGVLALMIAFWSGAIIGVSLIGLGKLVGKVKSGGGISRLNTLLRGVTIKSEVPFAPFLVFAVFLVFFTGITVEMLENFLPSLF